MAARKAVESKKASASKKPPRLKRDKDGNIERSGQDMPKNLSEARKRNYENAGNKPTTNRKSQAEITADREKNAEKNREAVRRREQQVAQQFAPGAHPNVLVVKRSEMAARAEQERIDRGKIPQPRYAGRPPKDGEPGFDPEPHHRPKPGPLGASPRHPDTPRGAPLEHVINRTRDVEDDGTPFTGGGPVFEARWYDGETDRDLREVAKRSGRKFVETEPTEGNMEVELINNHSPEGAAIDSKAWGRPVKFVPNDAWLDPKSHNPDRKRAEEEDA